MNRANVVEYVAADEKRETISYVRVTTPDGKAREYFAEGASPAQLEGRPRRTMGCVDCHSRPAHTFGATAERAVDAAPGDGLMNAGIPFVRREAVRALKAAYPSHEVAIPQIDRTMREALNARLSRSVEEADLRRAIGITQALYRHNVFPSMNIDWGTYPDHSGHLASPGCFGCHDESHTTRTVSRSDKDCELCHPRVTAPPESYLALCLLPLRRHCSNNAWSWIRPERTAGNPAICQQSG